MTYQECEMINAKTRAAAERRLEQERAQGLLTWAAACLLSFIVGLML